jgi:hypothetical protein
MLPLAEKEKGDLTRFSLLCEAPVMICHAKMSAVLLGFQKHDPWLSYRCDEVRLACRIQ